MDSISSRTQSLKWISSAAIFRYSAALTLPGLFNRPVHPSTPGSRSLCLSLFCFLYIFILVLSAASLRACDSLFSAVRFPRFPPANRSDTPLHPPLSAILPWLYFSWFASTLPPPLLFLPRVVFTFKPAISALVLLPSSPHHPRLVGLNFTRLASLRCPFACVIRHWYSPLSCDNVFGVHLFSCVLDRRYLLCVSTSYCCCIGLKWPVLTRLPCCCS